MSRLLLLLLIFSDSVLLTAQQFRNGGLESVFTKSTDLFQCEGWKNVPYDDPVCEADVLGRDSPNITSHDGPITYTGICGDPHSGKTFVSGIRSINPGDDFQEGIMQQLDSLVPGHQYRITFWQAVVKQKNLRDKTGSWAVYIDSVLAGVSKISTSYLDYDNTHLDWDKRSIDFIATNTSQWIKFLPMDDDSDAFSYKDDFAGLRMGIDDISISPVSNIDVQIALGPIPGNIIVNNKSGMKMELNVLSPDGNSVMKVEKVEKDLSSIDMTALPAGTYTLEFTLGKEFYRESYAR